MTRVASLLVLVSLVLSVGCGSGKAKTYSARDVERAFSQAGIPFPAEVDQTKSPNFRSPSRGLEWFLPRAALNHLQAFLWGPSDARTLTRVEMAFVFDSVSSAEAAFRARSLGKWAKMNHNDVVRVQTRNVIIAVALTSDPKFTKQVHRAIAALR